jgi:hypothetical protein
MAKSREPKNKVGEDIILSSGVVVTVTALAPGIIQQINKDNPDAIPPKKTITVLGGTEEVDNLDDPEYREKQKVVEATRNGKYGEAVIEFCLSVDLSKYDKTIKRLEKIVSPYPDDPDERQTRFLYEYALKKADDYSLVITSALEQISISDKEVQERIATFQSNVQGNQTNGTAPSGADEAVGLAVVNP